MPTFSTASPDFDNKIPMLKPTDANSNVVFNNLIQKLINNDTFLYNQSPGCFKIKQHNSASDTFASIDRYPLEDDYGHTTIRIFNNSFDGVVIENASGSGNYASQLYISSDKMLFRRRQGTKIWPDWQRYDDSILFPKAGARFYPSIKNNYISTTEAITGSLKIKLPTFFAYKMISFDVRIYTYQDNGMATFHIGGYDYLDDKKWYCRSAYCESNKNCPIKDRIVQFGHDGSNSCIYIGSYNDVWKYPQVCITNILLGYSPEGIDTNWYEGIEISFVQSGAQDYTSFTNPWSDSH